MAAVSDDKAAGTGDDDEGGGVRGDGDGVDRQAGRQRLERNVQFRRD